MTQINKMWGNQTANNSGLYISVVIHDYKDSPPNKSKLHAKPKFSLRDILQLQKNEQDICIHGTNHDNRRNKKIRPQNKLRLHRK
jgi:hypothetical protein